MKRWRFARVAAGRWRPLFRCSRIRVTIECEVLMKDSRRGRLWVRTAGDGRTGVRPRMSSLETWYFLVPSLDLYVWLDMGTNVIELVSIQIPIPIYNRCSLCLVAEIRFLFAEIVLLFFG